MEIRIYLSGHMHNNWREKVIDNIKDEHVSFLLPFKGNQKTDERHFAIRDKLALHKADIVFAYIQDTPDYKSPRYFGLGLELGYAAGLNKVIILVNELKGKIESFDFAVPFATASTSDFQEGIELLKYAVSSNQEAHKYQ